MYQGRSPDEALHDAYAFLRTSGNRPHSASLSVLVSSWVAIVLLPLCDPGGFFRWFMD